VGSHMFQHVRCRLKGRLTNPVHADRVAAVLARHKSATYYISGRGVHKRTSVGGRSRFSDSLAFHLPHRKRCSPLWFSGTSVQIKLAEQVPLRTQKVTR
jgi:hypothetical protein